MFFIFKAYFENVPDFSRLYIFLYVIKHISIDQKPLRNLLLQFRWNQQCAYTDMYCQTGIISWRPCWIYAILDPADRQNSSSIVFPVSVNI